MGKNTHTKLVIILWRAINAVCRIHHILLQVHNNEIECFAFDDN